MSEGISREESLRMDLSTETGEPLVEVENLRTYYGGDGVGRRPVKAVDGVSFDIERGETLGLVGESGCGKTTLGRTLVQLERATGGSVRFDGQDVTQLGGEELKSWRRNAQIVFQDPESSLNDRMTVGEIVREPLDVHEWETPHKRRERVRNLLTTVGLREEHYFRYPHQFSGGQRQRVGIARALALEPEFVVLDEPVSALDVSVQAKILNLLSDLQDEFGLTYLFIAHDLSVVRHVCDRVAVMYLGNIMELSETEALFEDPANPYTHALLSAIPEPDPTSDRERITLRGTPPSPRNPPDGCPFTTRCPAKIRPEGFEHVDPETWGAVEQFREVIRERRGAKDESSLAALARAADEIGGAGDAVRGLTRTVRSARNRLRDEHEMADLAAEVREDVFEGVDLPQGVASEIDTAIGHALDDDIEAADDHLDSVFDSECDRDPPTAHEIGPDHASRCHRHEGGHESVVDYLDRTQGE
jgi:peptide/nickel transport system ATP-binding protein